VGTGEVSFGELAEGRHQTAAVPGAARQHDMAGLNAFQGDRGDIRAHAIAVKAGGDGHCLPGGDEFELVLERFNERTVRCLTPVGTGIDAPEGTPGPSWLTRG
jgi:hypothetical protein